MADLILRLGIEGSPAEPRLHDAWPSETTNTGVELDKSVIQY